jgi:tetratricopeptide (TPR) repeat protein
MFGNLLLEMSQYENAQRYFDTVLNSSNPNDEEIASLFFNYGHIHRLKGDFNRAINCYNRAYHFHMTARPKRFANAGKTLNDLGVVYSEQGNQSKAEECFLRAMKFYKGNISQEHVHVAETLIHLSKIDCDRQHVNKYIYIKSFFLFIVFF